MNPTQHTPVGWMNVHPFDGWLKSWSPSGSACRCFKGLFIVIKHESVIINKDEASLIIDEPSLTSIIDEPRSNHRQNQASFISMNLPLVLCYSIPLWFVKSCCFPLEISTLCCYACFFLKLLIVMLADGCLAEV